MVSWQAVKEIQRALQAIFSDSIVLFGGSYWTGEAGASSDLDFYILRPFFSFFAYRRSLAAVAELKKRLGGISINCLVMPRFFYERGWYFVAGETEDGRVVQSPLNAKIIFRTAIKLAYWNYLLSLLAEDTTVQQFTLAKMAQHLAVARTIVLHHPPDQRGFSTQFLLEQAAPFAGDWNSVQSLLKAKQQGEAIAEALLPGLAAACLRAADELYRAGARYWRFSLINYCIYNSKFLHRKNPLFLFNNPDKIIVDRLRSALNRHADLTRLREEMRTIVFPVIMI